MGAENITEQARARKGAADLLIGPPSRPSFVDFFENLPDYRPRPQDSCPLVILWSNLGKNTSVLNTIARLLKRELDLMNQEPSEPGFGPINLLVGINYGSRYSKLLRNMTGLAHTVTREPVSPFGAKYRPGTTGVLVRSFTSDATKDTSVRDALRPTRVKGVLSVIGSDYPADLESYRKAKLSVGFAISISDLAQSPMMDRFDPRQVANFRDWDNRQRALRA